jgi:hypothetical protein
MAYKTAANPAIPEEPPATYSALGKKPPPRVKLFGCKTVTKSITMVMTGIISFHQPRP